MIFALWLCGALLTAHSGTVPTDDKREYATASILWPLTAMVLTILCARDLIQRARVWRPKR